MTPAAHQLSHALPRGVERTGSESGYELWLSRGRFEIPILKSVAAADLFDQHGRSVFVLLQLFETPIHETVVEIIKSSAKGKTEQLSHKVTRELVLSIDQSMLQAFRAVDEFSGRQRPGCVNKHPVFCFTPATNGIIVFEAEAEGIHRLMAGGTCRLSAMLFQSLSHRP